MSKEFFYIEGGERRDAALHNPMLNNPDADAMVAQQAIELAILRGASRRLAERLYGTGDYDERGAAQADT